MKWCDYQREWVDGIGVGSIVKFKKRWSGKGEVACGRVVYVSGGFFGVECDVNGLTMIARVYEEDAWLDEEMERALGRRQKK